MPAAGVAGEARRAVARCELARVACGALGGRRRAIVFGTGRTNRVAARALRARGAGGRGGVGRLYVRHPQLHEAHVPVDHALAFLALLPKAVLLPQAAVQLRVVMPGF